MHLRTQRWFQSLLVWNVMALVDMSVRNEKYFCQSFTHLLSYFSVNWNVILWILISRYWFWSFSGDLYLLDVSAREAVTKGCNFWFTPVCITFEAWILNLLGTSFWIQHKKMHQWTNQLQEVGLQMCKLSTIWFPPCLLVLAMPITSFYWWHTANNSSCSGLSLATAW